MFDRHGDAGQHEGLLRISGAAAHHRNRPAIVWRRFQPCRRAFIRQEFQKFLVELLLRKEAGPDGGVGRRLGGPRLREVCQFLVCVAMAGRIKLRFDRA